MDMDNTDLINNVGLNSLSGFSYQIKVFIFRLTQIHQGQCVEFETLDDVAVRFLPDKDSVSDSCFKWSINENFDAEVFQVKQTNVTETVGRQVLYNWLMAYNQKSNISKYTLYVARGYSINKSAFTVGPEKEYQKVIESEKSSTALVTHVKEIYKNNPTKFAQDYQEICSKFEIEELDDIDQLIKAQLGLPLHASAPDIGNTYFEKRVNEFFNRI